MLDDSLSYNTLSIPLYSYNSDGSIRPNPLFHRSNDKLHSRCIEYPFAASKIGNAQKILDVGSGKANNQWIQWLDNLPISVWLTDYDTTSLKFDRAVFYQSDVRKLPFENEFFDKITAVSVIEHIGLAKSQATDEHQPHEEENGDYEAVKELARVLKTGGELIMTLPFGIKNGLILGDEARCYTIHTINKFNNLLEPITLDYYEYQYINAVEYFDETENRKSLLPRIRRKIERILKGDRHPQSKINPNTPFPGLVTWRKQPMEQAKAVNSIHTDGVVCGVWKKNQISNNRIH